ncbi:SDR family oxidoreductase [Agriterribacter sp.]|uniref:SDR family oxidoreductase n=1 Tax=Agriterribacter sp. TaxID=2821509 RepID=UPI002C3F7493|nr:SDR family oxidoreductase [Agriterribacter sp.]HRO46512.1 SDR family oxidoreductase [Agriterribacter sp.]HRQ17559.1 SDR family oxidoreductase [Agriterribacter sp.]
MSKAIIPFFHLHNKLIWVVGGAGYLGQVTVVVLKHAGAKVICIDLEDRAAAFVQSAALGPEVIPATLDVRDGAAIQQFVAEQVKQHGVPDGLVNLTFGSTSKKLEELSEKEFDEVNHTGLTATFLLAREAGMQMAGRGSGSIVLFSSMYGSVSPYPEVYEAPMNKNPIEYGVGKAGIIQMTRYLAVHWGKRNVRCNCISPGPFPSPSVQNDNPAFVERLAKRSPMGRIGKPEEIAGSVAFLLSASASYITGHNLRVDGGWTSW